ncbi:DUF6368 family protein [Pseudomonas protegens]|uniref:DUF6368 family protein n=1 Tax=Pseudomonas protegens TaxID=380021 RepID=UPI0029372D96|nr:DUF6368 family protein [Pseudomonas protegens]WOE77297.1 DUF6368 family protein [Pseudomonas protegens]
MAGPTVRVLLPRKIDSSVKSLVRDCLAELADQPWTGSGSFFIEGSPMLYMLGSEYPEELAWYAGLAGQLGWLPEGILSLAAMDKDQLDHQRLGQATLALVRRLDGVVAFCASIHAYTRDSEFLAGLAIIEHEDESIFSAADFAAWLGHGDFRLVK